MDLTTWVLTVIASAATTACALAVPAIRDAVTKFIATRVEHQFNERIERLKSELRRKEEALAADLRANEQQLKSLTDAALSLRSSRQSALDTRRLQAVEKLWAAKIATDRMKLAAKMVASLNLEELYKAAEAGEANIQTFAQMLETTSGLDPKKPPPLMSASSERPFISPDVWGLFSAYQGVIVHSVMHLKILGTGTTHFVKKEDNLKPLMLIALPEYKAYIEKYGFGGYYHLLDMLEEKLLVAIAEMLDGKQFDDATLKRNAEIMAAVRELNKEKKPDIPDDLRGSEVPEPEATLGAAE